MNASAEQKRPGRARLDELGFTLIDADNHYYEPHDAFTRYMEPPGVTAAFAGSPMRRANAAYGHRPDRVKCSENLGLVLLRPGAGQNRDLLAFLRHFFRRCPSISLPVSWQRAVRT